MSHSTTSLPSAWEKAPMIVPKRLNGRVFAIGACAIVLLVIYFFHFVNFSPVSNSIRQKITGLASPDTTDGPGDGVVLLTASDGAPHGSIPHQHDMAIENRQEYCDYHGYSCVEYDYNDFTLKDGTHPVWKKVLAVQRAFAENPDAEWVFWVDLDVIIMNPAHDLSSYLLSDSALESRLLRSWPNGGKYGHHYEHSAPSSAPAADINLVIANDYNGLNAGVFALRRSKWTDMLLDLWFDELYMEKDWPGKEQDALIWMMDKHEHIWKHVGFVDQHVLNAYYSWPDSLTDLEHDPWQGLYQEGDLLVHLAGCWVQDECEPHWTTMWERRKKLPEHLLKSERKFP